MVGPHLRLITTSNRAAAQADLKSFPMRLRTGAVLAAVACLVLAAAATAAVPKPTAGRCAMALSVFLRPAGRIDVFQYREISGNVQNTFTLLATANVRSGSVSALCDRVRPQMPPAHPRGLAGPWPRTTESRIFCGSGGTVQVRPIVSRGRVVGTRLLLMRKAGGTGVASLYGRHVIVDAFVKARSGGISYDPGYCQRNFLP
jgi:hypothetical protein